MESIGFYLKQVLVVVLSASLLGATVPPPSPGTIGASPVRLDKPIPALTSRPALTKRSAAQSTTLTIEPKLRPHANSLRTSNEGMALWTSEVSPDESKPKAAAKGNQPSVNRKLAENATVLEARGLEFVENKGQFDSRVKFRASNRGKTLWLTENRIIFDFLGSNPSQAVSRPTESQPINESRVGRSIKKNRIEQPAAPSDMERHVISQEFVEASKSHTIETRGVQQGTYNYFSGSDPSKWQTGVRRYSEIVYHDLWKGVDFRLYGKGPDLEQEFILQPGADLNQVQVTYEGVEGLDVQKDGSLLVKAARGQMRESAPRIYQEIAGRRVSVDGRFRLLTEMSYTFDIGDHDPKHALIIDPTLLYSTYLGGSAGNDFYNGNFEVANAVAVDASGNAYVAGYTLSSDFPVTPGVFQGAHLGASNANVGFVSKLNPTGSRLVYSSYFNYTVQNGVAGIAVDAAGNAYITGVMDFRSASSFPLTPSAYSNCGGSFSSGTTSGFLSVLNSSGTGLLYSTCFGAFGFGGIDGLAIDSNGHAFIVGVGIVPTTPNAVQTSQINPGLTPGFVTAFDTTASGAASLYYSTYFGITDPNPATNGVSVGAIAVDSFGNAYITGVSGAGLQVTPGAFQTSSALPAITCNPGSGIQVPCPHAFVAKLNPTAPVGQSLIYSTYIGGTEFDVGTGIAVDSAGNAYITGTTVSNDFPVTPGAFQTAPPGVGGNTNVSFVAKLNASGSSLLYATYIEPVCAVQPCIQEGVRAGGIAIDALGNAYVTGSFRALIINLPTTPDAFQNTYSKVSGDFSESFLLKLNATGSALLYGSYLGGEGDDVATAVAVDQNGDAYVVGHTSSATFPITPGAFQQARNGTGDAFVSKFPLGVIAGVSITAILPAAGGNSGSVTVYITGSGLQASATLELVCSGQPTVTASNVNVSSDGRSITGTFNLTATNPGTCTAEVVNPDGTSASSAQPFTVEAGGAANVWVDLVGLPNIRGGRPQTYFVVAGNRGNIDANQVRVWVEYPPFFQAISATPNFVPSSSLSYNGNAFLSFDVNPTTGSLIAIPIQFTAPDTPNYAHEVIQLEIWEQDLPH